MKSVFRLLGPAALLLPIATAAAQTFAYPTVATTTGLALNGAAAQSTNHLRVTNSGAAQVGSVWFATPVMVREGFETEFSFVMSTGVEGLAFVVHGAPAGALALGGDFWGVGYGFGNSSMPIPNSLAIEIDAVQQGFLNDTSANEVSIHTVGMLGNSENEGVSIGRVTPAADLSNNQVHTLRVRYVPGVITIFVDGAASPAITAPFTFENGGTQLSGGSTGGLFLPTGDAWVGFTSAAPLAASQFAEVRSWNWVSFSLPDDCYVGNVHLGTGGPYDLLTVNGGNGGFFRTAQIKFADPFTVSLVPPPGQATAPFLLLVTAGIAGGATVTTTPWGETCFPVTALEFGTAPKNWAVPLGLFLPAELTLQALMITDPSANTIEITNAVALQFTTAPAPAISSVTPYSAVAGAAITINGSNFSPFAAVEVAGVPATVLSATPTQVRFAMPPSVSCGTTLRVVHPDGAFAQAPFNATPTVTSQPTTSGSAAGGSTYIVIGTGFAVGTTVTIGGNPANVSSVSATLIIATTPPGTPGPAPVVITTPGGCTVNASFTYL